MTREQKQPSPGPSTLQPFVAAFEGRQVATITYRGRPCWIVANVGEALGYADKNLSKLLSEEWSGEFRRGEDFDVVEGHDLRDLKRALEGYYRTSPNTRAITVLYKTGLDLVCIKTDKPLGRKLRRWIVDEVLPQIRQTGSYSLPGAAPDPGLAEALIKLVTQGLTDATRALTVRLDALESRLDQRTYAHGLFGRDKARELLDWFKQIASLYHPGGAKEPGWASRRGQIEASVRKVCGYYGAWSSCPAALEGAAWKEVYQQQKAARDAAPADGRQMTLFDALPAGVKAWRIPRGKA